MSSAFAVCHPITKHFYHSSSIKALSLWTDSGDDIYMACCVQFVCQEGHGDFVSSVDERETCSYIVMVHTSRICAHPSYGPPPSVTSLPILCNPLLSADDYEMYMNGTSCEICASLSYMFLFVPGESRLSGVFPFALVYFHYLLWKRVFRYKCHILVQFVHSDSWLNGVTPLNCLCRDGTSNSRVGIRIHVHLVVICAEQWVA